MNSVTTSFELAQKILDLQIICSKKDIEIYKLKKQINDMINITVLGLPKNFEKDNIEIEIKEEPLLDTNGSKGSSGPDFTGVALGVKKEKMIQVKVKECGDCRSEDRRSFPTKGYKCEDEECMNFK
jgi:hypothetical protein